MVSQIIMGVIVFCLYFLFWAIVAIAYIIKHKSDFSDDKSAFKRIMLALLSLFIVLVGVIIELINVLSLLGGTISWLL